MKVSETGDNLPEKIQAKMQVGRTYLLDQVAGPGFRYLMPEVLAGTRTERREDQWL
jgi:hypothetical protein